MEKINSEFEIFQKNLSIKNKTIVDIGCGVGKVTRALAENGAIVHGTDLPDLIEKAKSITPIANEQYKVGSAENLPYNDNFADILLYFASFHHVPKDKMDAAMLECYRILKSNGLVVFLEPVPKKNSYYELTRLVEDEAKILSKAHVIIQNCQTYNFKCINENYYYLERSYLDYKNLLDIYVTDDIERNKYLQQAEKVLLKFSKNINTFRFRSICRVNILETIKN